MLSALAKELRHAARVLFRNPAFTLTAVVALSMGIGATAVIFSVVNAVILRPLPFPSPDELFVVGVQEFESASLGPTVEEYRTWQELDGGFEAISAFVPQELPLLRGESPELLIGAAVPANFFALSRVDPLLGRRFRPDEDDPSAEPVVVLGYGVWQRVFGSDGSIVGQTVVLGGQQVTVVGVMPPGFGFPAAELQFLVPLNRDPLVIYSFQPLRVYGRLRTGIDIAQAGAELNSTLERIGSPFSDAEMARTVRLTSLHQQVTGVTGRLPMILLAAVVLVLLIAVVNVTNLMVGHVLSRTKELAIRASLGATRMRVLCQLMCEGVLLAIVSGGLGLTIAGGLTGAVSFVAPTEIPRIDEVGVDGTVALFTLLVSLACGVLLGLYPAWKASGSAVATSLNQKYQQARFSGLTPRGVRAVLTISEIALATVLCLGAGLFLKSFAAQTDVGTGIAPPENVIAMQVPDDREDSLQPAGLRVARNQRLMDSVAAVPGVLEVAMSTNIPLVVRAAPSVISGTIDEHPTQPGLEFRVRLFVITPDYLRVVGTQLLNGRVFSDDDVEGSPPVAIASAGMAENFWPGEDALGKTLSLNTGAIYTIVGVVADVKTTESESRVATMIGAEENTLLYLPMLADPIRRLQNRFVLIQTGNSPGQLIPALRQAILNVEPDQTIPNVDLFDDIVYNELRGPRFRLVLLGSFAIVAAVIAVIGIYGVLSHSVATRTHEMAVRMAVGARGSDVMRLVVVEGMAMVLTGVLLGLLVSLPLSELIQSFLFETESIDGPTYAAVASLFILVAFGACLIPAFRAATGFSVRQLNRE